jgi:hypothetical protein
MKITQEKAMQSAMSRVGALYSIGGQWAYSVWDSNFSAYWVTQPRPYEAARASMAQSRIDKAREMLGLQPVQYDGGRWYSYLSK